MSSTQRLEGPDLEELLAKVRSDFGEAATIVEANRLRKGGIGGFFAKETFEVVLDVDEQQAASSAKPAAPAATPTPAPAPAPKAVAPGPDSFAEALAEATEDHGAGEEFVPFTLDELATRVDDPAPSFTAALAAAVEQAVEPAWPAQSAIAEVTPVVAAGPKVARLVHGGLDGVVDLRNDTNDVPQPDVSVGLRHFVPQSSALGRRDLDGLAALGVPVDRLSLPERSDEPATVALIRLLERLPAPPPMPRSQGAVVAVVGDRDTAAEIAGMLGLDTEVVVASRRRNAELRSADDADERRRAWKRRKRPTVVVVDAPFGVAGDRWANDVLAALEPTVALGAVDAGRKPEDINAWAEGLGGLDALAVDGLDRTTTPAAVLRAGLPVALIDGAAATPARWAALLTDRLATLAA